MSGTTTASEFWRPWPSGDLFSSPHRSISCQGTCYLSCPRFVFCWDSLWRELLGAIVGLSRLSAMARHPPAGRAVRSPQSVTHGLRAAEIPWPYRAHRTRCHIRHWCGVRLLAACAPAFGSSFPRIRRIFTARGRLFFRLSIGRLRPARYGPKVTRNVRRFYLAECCTDCTITRGKHFLTVLSLTRTRRRFRKRAIALTKRITMILPGSQLYNLILLILGMFCLGTLGEYFQNDFEMAFRAFATSISPSVRCSRRS